MQCHVDAGRDSGRCNHLAGVDKAVVGHPGDIYRIVTELRPNIIALGFDQSFKEADVERKCAEHGVPVKVVRLPQFDHDLDATRKIIQRIGDRITSKTLYSRDPPVAARKE